MKKLSLPTNPEDYHEVAKEDLLYILNESTKELIGALGNALKPTGADHVLLTGCSIIESLTSVSIADGFVFTGGEIYRVIASGFIFPAELPDGTDPLSQVWLVPEDQTLPNADRTYEDGRQWRVFTEVALKLSGSSVGAIMRMDDLSYYANTAPSGTIRLWRPPAGKTINDVAKFPSGKGKGEFLGWTLAPGTGGYQPMGMNWDETAEAGVRDVGDYTNINEVGGKTQRTLTAAQSGMRGHYHYSAMPYKDGTNVPSSDGADENQNGGTPGYRIKDVGFDTSTSGGLGDNASSRRATSGPLRPADAAGIGDADAVAPLDMRSPFFMAYIFIKN